MTQLAFAVSNRVSSPSNAILTIFESSENVWIFALHSALSCLPLAVISFY